MRCSKIKMQKAPFSRRTFVLKKYNRKDKDHITRWNQSYNEVMDHLLHGARAGCANGDVMFKVQTR